MQMLSDWFRTHITLNLSQVYWEKLIRKASIEQVLPGLAGRTHLLGIQDTLPPEILSTFAAAESLNRERNQVILTEALFAAMLLNRIGIQPVGLKGIAYLLSGIYSNPAARFVADIDFLVPQSQLPAAIAQLDRHGYFESDSDRLFQFRHHHSAMRRAGLPHIELHHRVGIGVCDRVLPASAILLEAKPITIDGATILVPSPVQLATHLVLHSQLAHPYDNRIFPPLRAMVDLVHLQSRFTSQIDWSAIEKTYRAAGESATLALHLQHTNHLLGTNFAVSNLPRLRWYRRLVLNRYPLLRFLDPIYLLMSLFSRRLRLVPQILSHPAAWPKVLRTFTSPAFYRNLFAL